MEQLLILLGISVGINLIMFLIAFRFKTDKLTDISYAVTFVTLAFYGLISSHASITLIILTSMICIWALRLGLYLLQRIRRIGKDSHFDDKREKFWSFLGFWLLQGFTVWVVMLPSNLYYVSGGSQISILSLIGILLWICGLTIEAISDMQKYNFINNEKNKGKWIEQGLWKYSRHPNYLGEIMVWLGIYIFTLTGLNTVQSFIGLISPMYIATLLIFVSGIPLLEKSADERWGKDPKYQTYKKQTSVLLLLPKRKIK